ncbi:MAG: hypothetical protein ACE5G7_04565 [Candidatus Hydrothermarchaeaceae archaeon]
MDDKEVERKIALIHALAGVILGVFTGSYLDSTDYNLINVLILGLILSYPLMLLTKKLYWEEMEFKQWLGKGYFIFFAVWIVVWTFIYNI